MSKNKPQYCYGCKYLESVKNGTINWYCNNVVDWIDKVWVGEESGLIDDKPLRCDEYCFQSKKKVDIKQ